MKVTNFHLMHHKEKDTKFLMFTFQRKKAYHMLKGINKENISRKNRITEKHTHKIQNTCIDNELINLQ